MGQQCKTKMINIICRDANNIYHSEQTNGFCFINNIAVGAGYLKYMYRNQIKYNI